MTFFTASFETVVLRFALMMATIIGAFVGGVPILAILALPIFLSAMTGFSFNTPKQEKVAQMKATKYNSKTSKHAA